jgi:uncharacterized protein (TIGR02302 family)
MTSDLRSAAAGTSTVPAVALAEPAVARRLDRLVLTTKAMMLFERAWRIALPFLVVVGAFVVVSWTGLWLALPGWARGLGILAFGALEVVVLLPARRFRLPSRSEALARIDRAAGQASRPAEVLDDRLANGASDPATEALWALHRRRAEAAVASLRVGWASPRMAEIDRYALRGLLPVALVATSIVAGPEKLARIGAAFDWRLDGAAERAERIDAWIDPPAYTGKLPVVLSLAGGTFAPTPRRVVVEVPVGSIITVRGSGGRPAVDVSGGLTEEAEEPPAPAAKSWRGAGSRGSDARLRLHGDASLAIGRGGARLGQFDLVATPDMVPTIALVDLPRANARGTLSLAYQVADDYGVIGAQAAFADPSLGQGAKSQRSLVDPPRVALALPGGSGAVGEAETTIDLSEHPWAGTRAVLTLVARDAGGNTGKSAEIEIRLPQKPFANPLARALVEQRRNLVLAPGDKARVMVALEALALGPEAFGTKAAVYLGLSVARTRLEAARKDSDLLDVADHLWQMALRIESGDLSEAERDLRATEQALRDALARKAPDEELQRLGASLRAALETFLRELALQDQDKDPSGPAPGHGNARAVDPQQLLSMLDRLEDMARSGNLAAASRLLDRLQGILENLRSARQGKPDPRTAEMNRALDALTKLGRDEQELRDDTHRRGQEAHRSEGAREYPWALPGHGFQAGPGLDPSDQAEGGRMPGEDGTQSRADAPRDMEDLRARQRSLRDKLTAIEKRLQQAWPEDSDLGGAEGAMREAEEALRQGPGGNDAAVEAQGRVLDALRRGTQQLAEAMQGAGSGEAGEADGESPRYGRRGGRDPLGRMTGNAGSEASAARYDPLGMPAAQRARRVLEELRRRLGEPARPREELDYLERLLRRYY